MEQRRIEASIIVRAYNAEATIARAIESALHQSFAADSYEVVVVNDGSDDGTKKILDGYTRDKRMRIIHQDNVGALRAANNGLIGSRGEYVVLLDADDEFLPEFLSETVPLLDSQQSIDFVYPDYKEEYEGRTTDRKVRHLMETVAGGIVFRRDRFANVGFYREGTFFAEYDLLLRTWDFWRGAHVEKPLFIYHRRAQSISASKEWAQKGIQQLLATYPDRSAEIRMIRSYDLDSV